jgi:exodeoxyribonuclease VII large subunit
MIQPEYLSDLRPLSVSELAELIRDVVSETFPYVLVKGEVSKVKIHHGHYYFEIVDANARINAIIWQSTSLRLSILPEEGKEYIFSGKVDYYPANGKISFIVSDLQYDSYGQLRAAKLALIQKLEQEGAFSSARKKPLPMLPSCIAIITSETGAVIHDLEKTIRERFPNMDILLYPALVQGKTSQQSVISALEQCNKDGIADLVIIARGGGSAEELAAFDGERLVRAIMASRIPVVTALGHTSDRTIADMVADLECRTPTDAGNKVVPDKRQLIESIERNEKFVIQQLTKLIKEKYEQISTVDKLLSIHIKNRYTAVTKRLKSTQMAVISSRPDILIAQKQADVQHLKQRLESATDQFIKDRTLKLTAIVTKLLNSTARYLESTKGNDTQVRELDIRMRRAVGNILRVNEQNILSTEKALKSLGPESVLARGYSIVRRRQHGEIIRDSEDVTVGEDIEIQLARGALDARVTGKP